MVATTGTRLLRPNHRTTSAVSTRIPHAALSGDFSTVVSSLISSAIGVVYHCRSGANLPGRRPTFERPETRVRSGKGGLPMAARSTTTRRKKTSGRKKSTGARKKTTGRKKAASRRKYSPAASETVHEEMKRYKSGKARSGPGGKGGRVKSRKQAIAIGISEARAAGKRVPKRSTAARKKKA